MKIKIPVLCALLLALSISVSRAQEGIKVSVVAVTERRTKVIVADPTLYYSKPRLEVTLRFQGSDVAKATRYRGLKIDSVTDDKKTNLDIQRFSGRYWNRLDRQYNYTKKTAAPKDLWDHRIALKSPARGATSITSLKGQLGLSLSDTVSVSFPLAKLKALVGKELEGDVFKTAGLKVTLKSFTGKRASIEFAGANRETREKLISLKLVDGQGKSLSTGDYVYAGFRNGSGSVSILKDPPAGSQLKIAVETKRKDVVVKFDLSDIPLP